MPNGLTRILRPATALAIVGSLVASAAVLTQSSEKLLRSSFERALGHEAASTSVASVSPANNLPGSAPVAGSEEFWLSALAREPGSVHAVSLGDNITLTLGGKERSYRITSISDVPQEATRIDTRLHPDRIILVTAKDTADALARPISLMIDLGGDNAHLAGMAPARAS